MVETDKRDTEATRQTEKSGGQRRPTNKDDRDRHRHRPRQSKEKALSSSSMAMQDLPREQKKEGDEDEAKRESESIRRVCGGWKTSNEFCALAMHKRGVSFIHFLRRGKGMIHCYLVPDLLTTNSWPRHMKEQLLNDTQPETWCNTQGLACCMCKWEHPYLSNWSNIDPLLHKGLTPLCSIDFLYTQNYIRNTYIINYYIYVHTP